jgi:hypothetical protein
MHAQHDIIKASDVSDKTKEIFGKELALLRKDLARLEQIIADLKLQHDDVQDKREEAAVIFYSAFRTMCARFELNVGKTKDPFLKGIVQVQKHALMLQGLLTESESILLSDDFRNTPGVQGCIDRLKEFVEKFEVQPIPTLPRAPGNRLVPRYKTISLRIPNFAKLVRDVRKVTDEDARCICSERKGIYGGMWRVRVYPCGKSDEAGNYVSVFIELWKGRKTPTPYFYRLVVLHATDCFRNLAKEHCSLFEELDSWGWNKGISLKTLLGDGQYIWPDDDSLRIEIGIRPESYRVLAQDCEEKCDKLHIKCANLQEEIEGFQYRKKLKE